MTISPSKPATYTLLNTWSIPQIQSEFCISRTVLSRYMRLSEFPKPVEWNKRMGHRKHQRFDRAGVAAVLKGFNETSQHPFNYSIQITKGQHEMILQAAELVYMEPDAYVKKVLLNHAKRIHHFAATEE